MVFLMSAHFLISTLLQNSHFVFSMCNKTTNKTSSEPTESKRNLTYIKTVKTISMIRDSC